MYPSDQHNGTKQLLQRKQNYSSETSDEELKRISAQPGYSVIIILVNILI